MSKEIIEGNKLVADFMGAEMPSCSKDASGKITACSLVYNGCRVDYIGDSAFSERHFKFHTSWDWLMPVVEKICNTEMTFKLESVFEWDNKEKYNPKYLMEIRDGGYHLKGSDSSNTLIGVVYQSVIQFITWYNQNPK